MSNGRRDTHPRRHISELTRPSSTRVIDREAPRADPRGEPLSPPIHTDRLGDSALCCAPASFLALDPVPRVGVLRLHFDDFSSYV